MNGFNKIAAVILSVLISTVVFAGSDTTRYYIENWLTAGPVKVSEPAFSNQKNIHGKKFKPSDLLKNDMREVKYPAEGETFVNNQKWQKTVAAKNGDINVTSPESEGYYIFWQTAYFHLSGFAKLKIKAETRQCFEMYIDNDKKLSAYSAAAKNEDMPSKTGTLELEPGRHLILIKSLYKKDTSNCPWSVTVSYTVENNAAKPQVNLSRKTFMDIDHLMNGKRVSSVSVSTEGDYYMIRYREAFPPEGKSLGWTEIVEYKTGKTVFSSKYGKMSSIKWVPGENAISYIAKKGDDKYLITRNLNTLSDKTLLKLPGDFGEYSWSYNGDFIIYTVSEKLKRDKSGVYKIEGMPDRWPWYRTRSQLFLLNAKDLSHRQITYGHLSCDLQDIRKDGKKILFSQSVPQYSERPYYRQIILEMDLETLDVDTVWTQNFSATVKYSPDGKKLLVTGSAALFNNAGVNLKKRKIPNDYDTQAYIYDLETKKAEPISKNFNPSIVKALWNKEDNTIYVLAEDRTYRNLWKYNFATATFDPIPANTDVINGFSLSHKNGILAYWGSSISYPVTAYAIDLKTGKRKKISDPGKSFFKDVEFGKTEDWTFKNKNGITIDGRIYYPPQFDPAKKYPLIVYYYGGTSPTARSFGGRYPKNLFAAHGYVVYVLQPSGATGYGQDFSALHVNGWGKENASDIIEGTEKFLKTHDFIDNNAVGCIGASYGGYMTMYLQTQTDIFSAAIAHAGISSISSYWGEGYWGYLYSSVASAGHFPWNDKKMYVNRSPLFNADKVNTPILLLHGTADTNVPTGESIQFYTALKLLGKPVELVEIEGQNHHITDYKKRIRWQKTILAWFDKYLKHQNDWWNNLYPEKNL